jgi:predicted ATPase/DNA-binding SARP family transcriptional activator/class 3 adenylate cyclase
MAYLTVRVLGPLRVSFEGEPVSGFASDKVRALLSYLALSPDTPHRREVLAGLLWPEFPERDARNSLRNALSNLRHVIRDRTLSPSFLYSTRQTIQFNSDSDYWLDADAFEALLDAVPRTANRLEQAVDLVDGVFLEGFTLADAAPFEEWLLLTRERFGRQLVVALHNLASTYEDEGAYGKALIHAQHRVELEPWEEEGQRQVMRLLTRCGRRDEALTRYATICQVLTDEFGLEPEPATTTLSEEIRSGAIAAAPPSVPGQEPSVDAQFEPPRSPSPYNQQPERMLATLPSLPVAASSEAERRTVTVLQTNVRGVDELLALAGTEDCAVIMSQVLQTLGAQVALFDGEVDRYSEDGLLACFGATTAHEDDPERAVLAALAMQDVFETCLIEFSGNLKTGELIRRLGLSIAVHTGSVIVTIGKESSSGIGAVMGEAVALVSQMAVTTGKCEVRVSEGTQRLVEPYFDWSPRDKISVGENGEVVHIYRALRRRSFASKMRGIPGLSSPLVGRDAELRAMYSAVERLCDGVGGIVTIVGEAGIGKSRLVAEFRNGVTGNTESVSGSINWIEGRCLSYTTGVAYSLWIDVLHSILNLDSGRSLVAMKDALRNMVEALCHDCLDEVYPFLAQMMSLPLSSDAASRLSRTAADGLRVLTFRAVEMLLSYAAERKPIVLVCEDLHWADDTSLELLRRMLPLVDRVPILWICVFRPEKGHGCWRIRELAARRYDYRHVDIHLDSLTSSESAQLVANLLQRKTLPGVLRLHILERAEGNPFYMEEIVRSFIDDKVLAYDELEGCWQVDREISTSSVPASLRGVLAARIARLPRDARYVLQLASVIGRFFTRRILVEISYASHKHSGASRLHGDVADSASSEDLDEQLAVLERAQMVRDWTGASEKTHVFKHQLLLEAAYDSLLSRKRRELHRRVADVLERFYPERVEEQPGLLAYHWERTGDSERAIAYLRRAGERAWDQSANAEAVAYFTRALDLKPKAWSDRYHLLLARAQVYGFQIDREAQGKDLQALQEVVEILDDNTARAELAVRQARYYSLASAYEQAIAAARTATTLTEITHDVEQSAMAYREWGRALHLQGRHRTALLHLERALSIAQNAGLRWLEAEILHILGGVWHNLGNDETGMACYERALHLCREIGDQSREAETLRQVGWELLFHVNWTESERFLQESLVISRTSGSRGNEAWTLLNLGIFAYLQGRYTQARDSLEQSLSICREIDDRNFVAESFYNLGILCTDLADYASARNSLEQSFLVFRGLGFALGEGWALVARGVVLHCQGDYASARDCYEHALRISREIDAWQVEAKALMYMGLLSHHLGDDRVALEYSQQAIDVMRTLDVGWAVDLLYVFTVRGHALVNLGQPRKAIEAYQQSLALRTERGQFHLTVEPLAGIARAALAQGDIERATQSVADIMDYLRSHPALEGTLEPLRIYLTCYTVLQANDDPRADEVLDSAYHLLQERARTIEDGNLQQSYLENVTIHREITTAWRAHSGDATRRNRRR